MLREQNRAPAMTLGAAGARPVEPVAQMPTNLRRTWADYFSVYDTERFRHTWKFKESDLYEEYTKLMLVNPVAQFLFKGLDDAIFGPGYHFEGAGTEKLQKQWRRYKMSAMIERVVGQSLWYGNGYIFHRGEGEGQKFKQIHAATVFFEEDGHMYQKYYDPKEKKEIRVDLEPDEVAHLKPFDIQQDYLGMSLFRPHLPHVWGMWDAMTDILQAIKRAAYAPLVAYLDLESIPSKTDKENAIKDFGTMLHSVVSASTNYVLDKRHKMEMVTAAGGRGGGLTLPVNDLLAPITSIMLLNFNIATAIFGGTPGVDPDMQELFSRRGIKRLKDKIKAYIEEEIFPLLIGSEADVQLVWDLSDGEKHFTNRLLLEAYSAGAISREFYLDKMNYEDEGTSFVPSPKMLGGGLDSG